MTAPDIHAAIALHQRGELAAAEAIYLQLLQADPRQVDALHYLGVLRMRLGRRDHAIELIKRALELAPENAAAWNNLGNVLAAGATPDDAGATLAYTQATSIDARNVDAWYNLGNLHRRQKRRDEAIRCFECAVALKPRFSGAYENIALLHKRAGRDDLAADAFRRWHAAEPDHPIAKHMAAAYSAGAAPERADDAFIVQMFDRFAGSFDAALANLKYSAPALLASALAEHLPFAERKLAVLDAGCGTGLCGPLLRSTARVLVGVDLSAGMLAKARERAVYDQLHEGELVAFIRAHPAGYDLIVCADTFEYFGTLDDALQAAFTALRNDGVLAFTVEAEATGSAERFRLNPHGRYTHAADYVRAALAAAGFELLQLETGVLRQEAGAEVAGHVVVARKSAAAISRE